MVLRTLLTPLLLAVGAANPARADIASMDLNDGFRSDSGPSRADPCTRALRPKAKFLN